MKIGLPFQYGKHDKSLDLDKSIKLKGYLDVSLRDKTCILKGITEMNILEIREILIKEIKKQIEQLNEDGKNT